MNTNDEKSHTQNRAWETARAAVRKPRVVMAGLGSLLLVAMMVYGADKEAAAKSSATAGAAKSQTVRVEVAEAKRTDLPVYIDGLGTVQAYYTVTVGPRVDGELMKVNFVEGQTVKAGDLLAVIDQRPYQAAFDQAKAAKQKDMAQLANAKVDLERYTNLAPEEFTSKQTLDTQRALVAQLEAQIASDQAGIDNAKTQLDYTTIRSPIQGRTGIRLVDPGNIVHAANATGIVVVTQVQPISVIFTLPAESLQSVLKAMSGGKLSVDAISRDGKTALGSGVIGLVDNQIDQTTGTVRLKASFPNKENKLWPGDYVNARVLLQTRKDVVIIPTAAVQRGPDGVFAYVVRPDSTVEARPLVLGEETKGMTIVEKGLQAGERVTTNNQYRLQPNAHVEVLEAQNGSTKPAVTSNAGSAAQ